MVVPPKIRTEIINGLLIHENAVHFTRTTLNYKDKSAIGGTIPLLLLGKFINLFITFTVHPLFVLRRAARHCRLSCAFLLSIFCRALLRYFCTMASVLCPVTAAIWLSLQPASASSVAAL